MRAIHIIEDEHRSLAAVLHGLLYLVREIRDHGMKPPFDVLGAMVYYIDAFPERFHHPKEDGYLFLRLRARCPEARPLLDRLEAEHVAGAEKIRRSSRRSRVISREAMPRRGRSSPPSRPMRRSTGSTCAARRRK